jgi:hypothetical protein
MAHPLETSIVRILSKVSNSVKGAGFLFSDGRICTCSHVIIHSIGDAVEPGLEINFPFQDQDYRHPVIVDSWLPVEKTGGDIAFLSWSGKLRSPLLLLSSAHLPGSPCEVYGFPQGFEDGVWASARIGNQDARGWYEIVSERSQGFPLTQGFSGAPVWDKTRLGIVGMVVAIDGNPANRLGFMIPAETLAKASGVLVAMQNDMAVGLIDSARADLFASEAHRLSDPDEMIRYLANLIPTRLDMTETYWIFIAISKIGGPLALQIFEAAKKIDNHPFIQLAINEGLRKLNRLPSA